MSPCCGENQCEMKKPSVITVIIHVGSLHIPVSEAELHDIHKLLVTTVNALFARAICCAY